MKPRRSKRNEYPTVVSNEPPHLSEDTFRVVIMFKPIDGQDEISPFICLCHKATPVRDIRPCSRFLRDPQHPHPLTNVDPNDPSGPALRDFDRISPSPTAKVDDSLPFHLGPYLRPKEDFEFAAVSIRAAAEIASRVRATTQPEKYIMTCAATDETRPHHWVHFT
jgi:hypothetical protein